MLSENILLLIKLMLKREVSVKIYANSILFILTLARKNCFHKK